MMKLGEYTFSIDSAAYQSLSRSTEYRWQSQSRVGRLPSMQFMGPGSETISLNGTLYPPFRGGLGQLDAMRAMAGKGEPLMLTDGTGRIWQHWIIEQVEETQQVLFNDGTPRKVEFRLQLSRYGEDV
jgi:phage protein U